MNLEFLFHFFWFLAPFLGILAFLAAAALLLTPRRRPDTLNDVAMFVREIDVLELAALLEPIVPQTLRKSLSDKDYRPVLNLQIRLVREYLSRVNHNRRIIHKWVAGEYAKIARKEIKNFTAREHLVVEAQYIAVKLRRHLLVAKFKLWMWEVLRMDLWPEQMLPRVPNLRVLYGVNMLANYRRLIEIMHMLSPANPGHMHEMRNMEF
jgi:hypothetical protein